MPTKPEMLRVDFSPDDIFTVIAREAAVRLGITYISGYNITLVTKGNSLTRAVAMVSRELSGEEIRDNLPEDLR